MKVTIKGPEPTKETFPRIREGIRSGKLYFFAARDHFGVEFVGGGAASYANTKEFQGVITIEQGD